MTRNAGVTTQGAHHRNPSMPPIAILVALADPTRCRIVEMLRDGPQPVHVLAASFDISRPAISRHLRVLKQARLISEKKTGRENRYGLHAEKLKPVSKWLENMQTRSASATAAKTKKPAVAPIIIAEAMPVVSTPVPETIPAPVAVRPRREASISQMGFDF